MDFDEAKTVLNQCQRRELRDHSVGDMNVLWTKGGVVAEGYFGPDNSNVNFIDNTSFDGEEAETLQSCGTLVQIERNDKVHEVKQDNVRQLVRKNIFEQPEVE